MRRFVPILFASALPLLAACAVEYRAGASLSVQGAAVPETKDDCKDDGWPRLTRPDGSPFENQGDCVSWVAAS